MSKTKQELISLGQELIQKRGINGFSYKDLAETLSLKRASVHYHFPHKSGYLTAVVEDLYNQVVSIRERIARKKKDPKAGLNVFIRGYDQLQSSARNCLPGMMSAEFNSLEAETKAALASYYDLLTDWLIDILTEGREQGVFDFRGEVESRAVYIVAALQGALQSDKINSRNSYKKIKRQVFFDLGLETQGKK